MLDGQRPVPCDDILEWVSWFDNADLLVAHAHIGDVEVSTVFLGIDFDSGIREFPVVFETRVFGGPLDQERELYATWDGAIAGHNRWCAEVRFRQHDSFS